jgi:hypothetical protein
LEIGIPVLAGGGSDGDGSVGSEGNHLVLAGPVAISVTLEQLPKSSEMFLEAAILPSRVRPVGEGTVLIRVASDEPGVQV